MGEAYLGKRTPNVFLTHFDHLSNRQNTEPLFKIGPRYEHVVDCISELRNDTQDVALDKETEYIALFR